MNVSSDTDNLFISDDHNDDEDEDDNIDNDANANYDAYD